MTLQLLNDEVYIYYWNGQN